MQFKAAELQFFLRQATKAAMRRGRSQGDESQFKKALCAVQDSKGTMCRSMHLQRGSNGRAMQSDRVTVKATRSQFKKALCAVQCTCGAVQVVELCKATGSQVLVSSFKSIGAVLCNLWSYALEVTEQCFIYLWSSAL